MFIELVSSVSLGYTDYKKFRICKILINLFWRQSPGECKDSRVGFPTNKQTEHKSTWHLYR